MRLMGWWVMRWIFKAVALFVFLCAVDLSREAVRQKYLDRIPVGEWTEETYPRYERPPPYPAR